MAADNRGCQMVVFKPKNPNLGKFWRTLEWKMLVYFMAIWSILWPFGLFCSHLVYFVAIWFISWLLFSRFGMLYQNKSGNPADNDRTNVDIFRRNFLRPIFGGLRLTQIETAARR
jgi:hypothetical protein